MNAGARISEDNLYRYALWRIWDDTKPFVLFIMLNPSTADDYTDDPTIRRCKTFAENNGFGGFYVGNLFAFRATNPKELLGKGDMLGPEYGSQMGWMLLQCQKVIFAWGSFPIVKRRQQHFIDLLPDALCLGKTKHGFPRHPLYVPSAQPLIRFSLALTKP